MTTKKKANEATTNEADKKKLAADAKVLLADLGDRIETADKAVKVQQAKQLKAYADIGGLLDDAKKAMTAAGQQWGEWLEGCPFKYSPQYANGLIDLSTHWAKVEAQLEDNPHMGVGEALRWMSEQGLRKQKSKGGGGKKGSKKPRLKVRVTFKALEAACVKHHLKGKLADVLALLDELKLRAGKQLLVVDVQGRPVEQAK